MAKDGPNQAIYEHAKLRYAPADLLLYKIVLIPIYAIEGAGKALSRGEWHYLNGVIFIDLFSRLAGHQGRRATLVREILDVDDSIQVRFNYFRNLYNWTDWFSPFLGTGVMVPGDEADWSPIGLWGHQRNRIHLPVNGRTISLSGEIPMEFIESIQVQRMPVEDASTEEPFLVIENPAASSLRSLESERTNVIFLDLQTKDLPKERVEIRIVDLNGWAWHGTLEEDYGKWEADLIRIIQPEPEQTMIRSLEERAP